MAWDFTTFGGRLEWLRRDRGVTQREVGEVVELSQDAVSKWETGKSPRPTPDIIEKVSALLRADPAWLTYGTGTVPTPTLPPAHRAPPLQLHSPESHAAKKKSAARKRRRGNDR